MRVGDGGGASSAARAAFRVPRLLTRSLHLPFLALSLRLAISLSCIVPASAPRSRPRSRRAYTYCVPARCGRVFVFPLHLTPPYSSYHAPLCHAHRVLFDILPFAILHFSPLLTPSASPHPIWFRPTRLASLYPYLHFPGCSTASLTACSVCSTLYARLLHRSRAACCALRVLHPASCAPGTMRCTTRTHPHIVCCVMPAARSRRPTCDHDLASSLAVLSLRLTPHFGLHTTSLPTLTPHSPHTHIGIHLHHVSRLLLSIPLS
ncbi:hypothetical protein JB92DRAFT_2936646 [Gautieria morchelliformis]|nr:hypothetical protein JB92DRAFT_2936646 [Gautieria morchelliformis]